MVDQFKVHRIVETVKIKDFEKRLGNRLNQFDKIAFDPSRNNLKAGFRSINFRRPLHYSRIA